MRDDSRVVLLPSNKPRDHVSSLNPMTTNYDEQSRESHRKKRRKINDATSTATNQNRQSNTNTNQFRWRTSIEHQTYTTKLVEALRHVRRRNSTASTISGSRAVREAADKALAISAKGRTRWSRAILTNRVKLRLKNNHKKAKIRSKIPPPPRSPPSTAATAATPPIEKRVKVLSRLVPGCRKISFPNLLDETTDYIAALQMQVRTMAALAELLSGSSTSSGSIYIEPASRDDNPVH